MLSKPFYLKRKNNNCSDTHDNLQSFNSETETYCLYKQRFHSAQLLPLQNITYLKLLFKETFLVHNQWVKTIVLKLDYFGNWEPKPNFAS